MGKIQKKAIRNKGRVSAALLDVQSRVSNTQRPQMSSEDAQRILKGLRRMAGQ